MLKQIVAKVGVTRKMLVLFVALGLGLGAWPLGHSLAVNSKMGASQQVGEPFRVLALAAGLYHSPALNRGEADASNNDTTPPTVSTSEMSGPPAQVFFTFQDTGSGLSTLVVTQSGNADTVVPPFVSGTTDPVVVSSTKIDQSQPMCLRIEARDVAGNLLVATYPSLVVTNTNDSGAGSLRQVIADACPGSTITFNLPANSTIALTSGELVINKNLTINGPGANLLTVSGNQQSRVFNIGSGVTATLDALTIANGKVSSSGDSTNFGGGIINYGTLTLTNSTLSGNSAAGGDDSAKYGGGIYNTGPLTLTNSTLSSNFASGGASLGGGIINYGTLTLTNSTLSGNSASGGGFYNYGGGIFNDGGTVKARNTLIAANSVSGGFNNQSPDVLGTFTSLGYNLMAQTGPDFVVNTLDNVKDGLCSTGHCSLRDAMVAANSNSDASTITFSVSGTIDLDVVDNNDPTGNNGLPVVSTQMTINGGDVITVQRSASFPACASTTDPLQRFRIFFLSAAGNLTLDSLTIARGCYLAADGARSGGGLRNDGGTLNLNQVTVNGNTARSSGGGIYNNSGGTLNIANSTISNNAAANGGGILTNQATVNIVNSTLSGNTASGFGGAHHAFGIPGTPVTINISNSTIADNSAGNNGAALVGTDANYTVRNSIFQNNTGGSSDCFGSGSITFGGDFNLRDDTSCPNSSAPTPANPVTNFNTTLALNPPGPTQTHALTAGSNAINAAGFSCQYIGSVSFFNTIFGGTTITTDQIGQPRSQPCDVGAFENASAGNQPPVLSGVGFSPSPVNAGQSTTLSGTATDANTGNTLTLTINWGDGSPDTVQVVTNGTPFSFNHTYATSNMYTAMVTVSDGSLQDQKTLLLTVNCVPNPVVTNTNDSGAGSLRAAIAQACPDGTITFASGVSTVMLTSGQLVINKNLTIQGLGANLTTIQNVAAAATPTTRVFQIDSGTVNLSGLTVSGGNAAGVNLGGGINNFGTLTITNSIISNNVSSDGGGGISNGGILNLTNSTVSGNSVPGGGGGIFNHNNGTITLINSTVFDNSAVQGGGLNNSSGTLNVINSTVSGNRGSNQGGGIYNPGNTVIITNSTVSGNSSNFAGGIFSIGTIRARNTIISGNTALSSPNLFGSLTTDDSNIVGNEASVSLAPLGNYGGATQTHALLPGSPAINAGNNCVLTNSCENLTLPAALTTDQRGTGFNRQVGSAVDIGAFEANYVLSATGGAGQTTTPNTAFTNSLVATLTEAGNPVSGVAVTFTANPAGNGATATLGGTNPATTNSSGQASVTATANANSGSYSVTASASPAVTASFGLTNGCPASCDDGNACTIDACDPTIGCTHTQLICDDSNACTKDTCDPVLGCVFTPINCDDGDPNTIDTCDPTKGCVNTPICNPVVTNTNDSGAGSLRQVITQACPGGTITFNLPANSTITLTSGELAINKNLTIQGPGANLLTISGNNASRVFSISSGTMATLDALTIANGNAAGPGGGIYNLGDTLTITNCTLSGNTASGAGGGIFSNPISETATLMITNSTLSGNSTSNGAGGGILSGNGTTTITNCTLSSNSTTNFAGGGILNGIGTLTITNSTLSGNSANGSGGGGIYNNGTAQIRSTIIAGNNAAANPDVAGANSLEVTLQGYNLIGNKGFTSITATTGDQIGTMTAPLDPKLSALGNYGGPTQTLRPLPGSPVIDAGTTATDPITNTTITTDQRGFTRPQGNAPDIGAVETNYVLAATSGAGQTTPLNTAFTNPLLATLTEAGNPVSGVPLTFSAPGSGASASLSGNNPATTNSSGQASVTATANANSGSYSVTASASPTVTASSELTNTCSTITVTNPATTTGALGVPFSQQFTQTGGSGNVTFTTNSTLPAGLTLASNGTLSGTPTQTGTFPLIVTATDGNNCMGTGTTYTLTINCVTNPVVTTNADSGAGSLREAIALACPGSTITFANTVVSPITLTSGELVIGKNLTIQGPGANLLTISGNNASRVFNISSGVTVTLDRLTIANGRTSSRVGGGILNNDGSTLTLTNSTVSGNSISGNTNIKQGGGIFNSGTVNLTNSTLSGNSVSGGASANVGGGIYNSGTLTLTNSTLSGNSVTNSGNEGGGIQNFGTLTITSSTLSGNSATGGSGGGILNQNTATIRNTIIAGNNATNGPDVWGALTSLGYNLIGNNANTIITPTTGDQVGTAANPINPLLALLGNYGGPTQTQRPLLGSPAINTGVTATDPITNTTITTDQRGFTRPQGNAPDIGAVETNYILAATSGTPQSATVNAAFTNPLLATLTESGQPVSGVPLTFSAPGSGASASFTGNPAVTDAQGQASVNATANNLTGSYTVTANTTPGLAAGASFNLMNDCPVISFMAAPVNPACFNAQNGSLTIQPSGGVGPYQYSISAGLSFSPNAQFSGLGVGTYSVVVKDANGCLSAAVPVTLTQPLALSFTTSQNNLACNGATNGSLTINAAGGTGAFMYSINNGASFQAAATFSGLGAGVYPVIVKDVNGCQTLASNVTLTQPAAISFTTSQTNPACNGATNGSLTINAAGGTGALLYSINNGASFQAAATFSGLGAGVYPVIVKDVNGCQTLASNVTLTQPAAINFTTAQTNPACNGATNGSLTINAAGGTGALLYSINGGQSFGPNPQFSGLGAGVYPVVVKDAAGCQTAASSVSLTQPAALGLSPAALSPVAAGQLFTQQFTPSGGTGALQVSLTGALPAWLTFNPANATLSGSAPQPATVSFTLVVSDQAGCTSSFPYTLNFVCPAITLAPASLPNGATGAAYTPVTFSAAPAGTSYSLALTGGQLPPGLTFADGVLSGTPTAGGAFSFTLTATGWGGCPGARTYTLLIVAVCPALTLNPASLPGGTVGSAFTQSLSASGGAGPYSYAVTGGALPGGLSLTAGGNLSGTPTASGTFSFTVTVTGAAGCAGSRNYTLNVSCPALTWTPASHCRMRRRAWRTTRR
jgi:hypothetical protein